MTAVFHQEMLNYIVKPQYHLVKDYCSEFSLESPEPIMIELHEREHKSHYKFDKENRIYDRIYIYYGSETGNSLRYATTFRANIEYEFCFGPTPLDDLPNLLQGRDTNTNESMTKNTFAEERVMIVVFTSTFGKGKAPHRAQKFLDNMKDVRSSVWKNCDFQVFALCSSAYIRTFAKFGYEVHDTLVGAGCKPRAKVQIADELMNQDVSFH